MKVREVTEAELEGLFDQEQNRNTRETLFIFSKYVSNLPMKAIMYQTQL